MRTQWFAWIAAQEEGDAELGRTKAEEILKSAQRYGLRRMTDLALAATVYGRQKLRLGKLETAREAFDTAIRLDPDLPEVRWNRLALALAARKFGDAPREVTAGMRATLADASSRRITFGRGNVLLATTGAALGAVLALMVVFGGLHRLRHDAGELAGRFLPSSARAVAGVTLLLAPLLLSFDVLWLLLFLWVLAFGYAGGWQKIGSTLGLLLALPLLPVLDRTAYTFDLDASPVIRAAEAVSEARYDQQVLESLEAAKNILPDDVDIRFLLGRLYQLYGQNDRAIAEYGAGAEIAPSDSRCLVNRGAIRFLDGDYGSALEDFREALKRDARNVAARFNLSLVLAETFQTTEAGLALAEARAIDPRAVQRYQDSPKIVKVVTLDLARDEARRKASELAADPRGRRLPGQFRSYRFGDVLLIPLFWGVLAAVGAAFALDAWRGRGRGYAQECQKCARTFCRLCKPPGESALLCSQCVHVYLRKDGVAIETKLQKVEEVRRRKGLSDRLRLVSNLVLPGSAAFAAGHPFRALVALALYFLGLAGAFLPGVLGTTPRPGDTPGHIAFVLFLVVAAVGWVAGQLAARRSAAVA